MIDIEFDERDPVPMCRFCELASPPDEQALFTWCRHFQCESSCDGVCDAYIYDISRRVPRQIPSVSHIDLSGLIEAQDL